MLPKLKNALDGLGLFFFCCGGKMRLRIRLQQDGDKSNRR
jgi:hypothetical protein